MATKHYLKNARVVGRVLRYAAEYQGQWVALLVFSSPAWHLKLRDQWLHWSARQVQERRHLVAQNSRFLVLAAPGRWPNLASRVLKLACESLARDWQEHFGYPVQVVETFVDPQRFRGTCYQAAGWQALGPTQGFGRRWQDFYTDTQHPKELWVWALGARRGVGASPCSGVGGRFGRPARTLASGLSGHDGWVGLALAVLPQADDRSAQAQGSAPQAGRCLDPDRFGGGGGLQRAARDR